MLVKVDTYAGPASTKATSSSFGVDARDGNAHRLVHRGPKGQETIIRLYNLPPAPPAPSTYLIKDAPLSLVGKKVHLGSGNVEMTGTLTALSSESQDYIHDITGNRHGRTVYNLTLSVDGQDIYLDNFLPYAEITPLED